MREIQHAHHATKMSEAARHHEQQHAGREHAVERREGDGSWSMSGKRWSGDPPRCEGKGSNPEEHQLGSHCFVVSRNVVY